MLLACLALAPASCGCTCEDGPPDGGGGGSTPPPVTVPLVISTMQPSAFIGYTPTPFSLFGSGFTRSAPSTQVTVTFLAPQDIAFGDRTSTQAQVVGTVISDTEIQGVTPVTDQPGAWPCAILVTDALGSALSPGPIAEFVGLTVFTVTPSAIRADQATPFQVEGLAFGPVGGQATVRFTSLLREFPIDSDTFDILVDVISPELVTGVTSTFPLTSCTSGKLLTSTDDEPPTLTCPLTWREPSASTLAFMEASWPSTMDTGAEPGGAYAGPPVTSDHMMMPAARAPAQMIRVRSLVAVIV
jgi:hypothetical protein